MGWLISTNLSGKLIIHVPVDDAYVEILWRRYPRTEPRGFVIGKREMHMGTRCSHEVTIDEDRRQISGVERAPEFIRWFGLDLVLVAEVWIQNPGLDSCETLDYHAAHLSHVTLWLCILQASARVIEKA